MKPGVLALCVLAMAAVDTAQGEQATEKLYGREDYVQYCSACHGEAADGKGPVANVLRPLPPALTRLHSKYGYPLGTDLVIYVLGDKMPRAHGSSDMPVWGRNLRAPDGGGREAKGIIWRIVNYLEAIQPRPATK